MTYVDGTHNLQVILENDDQTGARVEQYLDYGAVSSVRMTIRLAHASNSTLTMEGKFKAAPSIFNIVTHILGNN